MGRGGEGRGGGERRAEERGDSMEGRKRQLYTLDRDVGDRPANVRNPAEGC